MRGHRRRSSSSERSRLIGPSRTAAAAHRRRRPSLTYYVSLSRTSLAARPSRRPVCSSRSLARGARGPRSIQTATPGLASSSRTRSPRLAATMSLLYCSSGARGCGVRRMGPSGSRSLSMSRRCACDSTRNTARRRLFCLTICWSRARRPSPASSLYEPRAILVRSRPTSCIRPSLPTRRASSGAVARFTAFYGPTANGWRVAPMSSAGRRSARVALRAVLCAQTC